MIILIARKYLKFSLRAIIFRERNAVVYRVIILFDIRFYRKTVFLFLLIHPVIQ